jgi:hypothetical protein
MTITRRIIAATVATGALALGMGITQSSAATLVKAPSSKTVVVNGGGQGGWPLAK